MTHTATPAQFLPASGPAREILRTKGQFWTPAWLAEVMAAWVTAEKPAVLFDPAVGPGTFFAAARRAGFPGRFAGYELDATVMCEGEALGLKSPDFYNVTVGDFIASNGSERHAAIISNPPYIRHHRLDEARKAELRQLATRILGFAPDGRTGLQLFFFLKCLDKLAPGGRLAFLLPADVCEGVSSAAVWNRIAELFRVEAVMTFTQDAAPFPAVDTNAMVFLLSKLPPAPRLTWMQVRERDRNALSKALQTRRSTKAVECLQRETAEAIETGLSRPPRSTPSGIPLRRFASVVRGIASGANEFFFLTRAQVRTHGLDEAMFLRALGRTRDCQASVLRSSDLENLEAGGRPTWLLNIQTNAESLSPSLRAYLQRGEQEHLHERALIRTRRPWFKMERRVPPPILFAYLGRRDCRFILNEAGVVPLTGFLCVYPLEPGKENARKLWTALNHPDTIANLAFAGKSYGGGAVKVEPRQLDSLEIPRHVCLEAGLQPAPLAEEVRLFEVDPVVRSKKKPSGK